MTIHQPYIMQPAVADPDLTYTAQELRQYLTAMPVMSGQGVLNPTSMNVTQRGAGANFSVDVAQGIVCVHGDDITNQGNYFVWSDATVNVATPSAPGSGVRIHRLVLQLRDKQSNGSFTTYDAVHQLLQDTGSGTPAEPNSALTLALITIHAGDVSVTNASIADQRFVWNDSWQSLGTPGGGWTGTVARARFRRMTSSLVIVHLNVSTTLASSPITFPNNMPSAYWPLDDVRAPLSVNNATIPQVRAFVSSTTGQVQIVVQSGTAIAGQTDGAFVYPLD